jgi:uncharacterized protein (DUF2062 family)
MTILQSFCCAIAPALIGMTTGYLLLRVSAKALKQSRSHNDF